MTNIFKECPFCKTKWIDLENLLNDNKLTFNGYQAISDDPGEGLFLFTHTKEGCGSTMACEVKSFQELMDHPIEFKPFTPGEAQGCTGFCLDENNIEDCKNPNCEGAIVRKLLQIVRSRLSARSLTL